MFLGLGTECKARALIEVLADKELLDSMVIAIPLSDGKGHTFVTIVIEYEWKPPRCSTCKNFDHNNECCPKNPKVVETISSNDDGFTVVKKKKVKPKQPRQIEGVRLTKLKPNMQYQKVEKGGSSKVKATVSPSVVNEHPKVLMISVASWNIRGMNFSPKQSEVRRVISENKLSVCAILESHVRDSNLVKMCTSVFKHWDWTSNGNLCNKGTRIIIGWNHYEVDVVVINQCDQAIHTRLWLKMENKEVFCSFIYAHNRYIQRRALWDDLCVPKHYVRGRPWCLLGDFNATLFLADNTAGLSTIDIAMRDFKECVDEFEVADVQCSGLQFTWNQKPKGVDGILKKLDRIMHARFKEVVKDGWAMNYSGFFMYQVVRKLKGLKNPFRKLLYEHGNIHNNVDHLCKELDRVQADLDRDPSNVQLQDEEAAYVLAYNDALILQERFLKQKAKINWLREGDSNSAYFHKAVKSRVSRSRINAVTNSDGVNYENKQVPEAFIKHYEVFLGQAGTVQNLDTHNLFDVILDAGTALDMVRNVSAQEVKSAMFSMGNDKSLGPDGYTAAFFKEAWILWGKGLLSFCKILANHIKESLKTLISPNQTAFVPGRSIADNILLTQELMHNYHLDRGVLRCAFKDDIQKAYDTMDWRRVRDSDLFSYHRYCSNMELINLCFTDDLFLFAYGDTHSARTIMDTLDEFKLVSRSLFPSLSNSMAYFGIVKELIKKGKSIKIGRINLFQLREGGLSRGKAKVAWEVVCLPKDEGGLGIRRLDFISPLASIVATRYMNRDGLNTSSKVSDVFQNGNVVWPQDLVARYPLLGSVVGPNSVGSIDTLEWRDNVNVKPLLDECVWQLFGPGR
ncbi:hypothetical protein Tco_1019195 [Tanacetum coccineum]|uniref:Reverse transcriptase domain-containing protein n=1 Tax=Tanacetum coccineum TaxID=301880 RepID=A0ABQ5FWJ6_9ASTR